MRVVAVVLVLLGFVALGNEAFGTAFLLAGTAVVLYEVGKPPAYERVGRIDVWKQQK